MTPSRKSLIGWRPGLRSGDDRTKPQNAPPSDPKELRVGSAYTRREIHGVLGGSVQEYMPHLNGRVVCVCVTREMNPDAPRIVLPSTGPMIRRWAEVLAYQSHAVPVFIKTELSKWRYEGDFRVIRVHRDDRSLSHHRQRSGRDDISMVLELEA